MTADEARMIHLLGIPPELYVRALARQDELLREFMHIAHADPEDRGSIPARLLDLMEEVRARHATSASQLRERLLAAHDAGEEHIDLAVRARPDMGQDARRVLEALEEADEYCRTGDLLTLEAPVELVEFRRWYLGEVVRQSQGEPPRPWPEHRDAHLVGR